MRRKTYSCDACGLPARPDRLMRVMYDGSLSLCPACLENFTVAGGLYWITIMMRRYNNYKQKTKSLEVRLRADVRSIIF